MSDESNGLPQTIEEALAYEEAIREEAVAIRMSHDSEEGARAGAFLMTPDLWLALRPLLRRPIPEAFIRSIPKITGKPYPSTGISSVQVQTNRMDNVLTELGWWLEDSYSEGGKLCRVTVYVGDAGSQGGEIWTPEDPEGKRERLSDRRFLLRRSSYGGVGQGSSLGNVHKGSFTNAAKRALAFVGPGHEIYLGTTDLDPDVNSDVGEEAPAKKPGTITKTRAKAIVDRAFEAGVESSRLRLAAMRFANKTDLGDCSTKAKATDVLAGTLSSEQAERLETWLSDQAEKRDQAAS